MLQHQLSDKHKAELELKMDQKRKNKEIFTTKPALLNSLKYFYPLGKKNYIYSI